MLAGVNDRSSRLPRSPTSCKGEVYKVNLIPYNPTGMYEGSSRNAIAAFHSGARRAPGIPATVRLTRGRDIAAACGQLAAVAS